MEIDLTSVLTTLSFTPRPSPPPIFLRICTDLRNSPYGILKSQDWNQSPGLRTLTPDKGSFGICVMLCNLDKCSDLVSVVDVAVRQGPRHQFKQHYSIAVHIRLKSIRVTILHPDHLGSLKCTNTIKWVEKLSFDIYLLLSRLKSILHPQNEPQHPYFAWQRVVSL